MADSIKYFTKLTSSSFLTFIKVNLLGLFSTFCVAIIGFYFIGENMTKGADVSSGFILKLSSVIQEKYFSIPLFLISIIVGPVLFFVFGNKYILSKIIYQLISDKAEKIIHPLIDRIALSVNKGDLMKKNGEKISDLKDKLANQLKNENENKWVKKAVHFGLQSAKLDAIDFSKEGFSVSVVLKEKIILALKESSEPSRLFIWIVLCVQWGCLLLLLFCLNRACDL